MGGDLLIEASLAGYVLQFDRPPATRSIGYVLEFDRLLETRPIAYILLETRSVAYILKFDRLLEESSIISNASYWELFSGGGISKWPREITRDQLDTHKLTSGALKKRSIFQVANLICYLNRIEFCNQYQIMGLNSTENIEKNKNAILRALPIHWVGHLSMQY